MSPPQPVETPLYERIKMTRQALGLSRAKAAKKWRLSVYTLRAWEERARQPSGLYLARITRILARIEKGM